MKQQYKSLFVSLGIHILVIGILFGSYKIVHLKSSKKTEQLLCVQLQSVSYTKPLPPKKKIPKKQKVIIEPQQVKKVLIKDVVTIPEITKEEEIIEPVELQKEEIKIEEVVKQDFKTEEPKKITPPEETIQKVSPSQKYVDENINLIVELLQENLYYPRRARKRGVEGIVNIGFTLTVDAIVVDINIVSSSSDILSKAAIKTIEDLSGMFPKPQERLSIVVPIAYELK